MDVISFFFFFPFVVHEFIFNVLRLALEVVPVVLAAERSTETRDLRVVERKRE